MMHIEFDETTVLPPSAIYDYMKTPGDWPRLFGAFGEVTDRGDGWFTVPMRRSPIPLTTRITAAEPDRYVAWEFRGFWKGTGETRLEAVGEGTRITGYETIHLPALLGLGRSLERVLEPRFVAVWESGWRRLHRIAPRSVVD